MSQCHRPAQSYTRPPQAKVMAEHLYGAAGFDVGDTDRPPPEKKKQPGSLKRSRACASCKKLRTKCEPEPAGPCRRCARLGFACSNVADKDGAPFSGYPPDVRAQPGRGGGGGGGGRGETFDVEPTPQSLPVPLAKLQGNYLVASARRDLSAMTNCILMTGASGESSHV